MARVLNPRPKNFEINLRTNIYVDKSGLINITNAKIGTSRRFMCVSRPRRFGKTSDVNMLAAYYSCDADTRDLFKNLEIARSDSFEIYLNKFNVIFLTMVKFFDKVNSVEEGIAKIENKIRKELKIKFSDIEFDDDDLETMFDEIYENTDVPFIFLIDEWDCILRMKRYSQADQKQYLDFLRNLLKDNDYVGLAYMTGILPIKKYGEHSALNMFNEYSMIDQKELVDFTGFTEDEVKKLCIESHMPFEKTKEWYNGYILTKVLNYQQSINDDLDYEDMYKLEEIYIYNPRSVVESMENKKYSSYWNSTENYEALKTYIQMNFDGLREKVIQMIAGEEVKINIASFQNDMLSFKSADDVLTLLVHLGYLTYNETTQTVRIPNHEVTLEFLNSIETGGWEEVADAIKLSDKLLEYTTAMKNEKVAEIIAKVHRNNTSIIKYNNENALSCVLSLAYYTAKKDYHIFRELPAGEGFADLVLVPKKNVSRPAMIIELKWNQDVKTARNQIEDKHYVESLAGYKGDILLVGINYDKVSKKHECSIEKVSYS